MLPTTTVQTLRRATERHPGAIQAVALGLVLLFRFVQRGAEAAAPRIDFSKACLNLAKLGAGRGQRVLAFCQPPRQPCGLVKGLIDGDLQRTFVIVKQCQLFARSGQLVFQLHDALFGGIELLLQRAPSLAQRPPLGGRVRTQVQQHARAAR